MWWAIPLCLIVAYTVYAIIPTFYNQHFNSHILRHIPSGKKRLALTFDDGPHPVYTKELLDILAENKVHATFFLVAKRAAAHPELVNRMLEEGHAIALHSYEHRDAIRQGYQYTKMDFFCSMAVMEGFGWPVQYYRPPWGRTNLFTLYFAKKHHLKPVLWSIMAEDWSAKASPNSIREKLLSRATDGGIICLHDAGGATEAPTRTLAALREALPQLKAQGYQFAGLDG